MRGFNVGALVSLGDMELALDYINEQKELEGESTLTIDANITEEVLIDEEADNTEEVLIDEDDIDSLLNDLEGDEIPIDEDNTEELPDNEISNDEEDDIDSLLNDLESDEYEEDNIDSLASSEDDIDSLLEVLVPSEYEIELQRKLEEAENKIEILSAVQDTPKKSEREVELERKLEEVLKRLSELESSNKNKEAVVNEPINEHIVEKKKSDTDKKQVKKKTQATIETPKVSKEQIYSSMAIEVLYKEVKKFLEANGVNKSAVDRSILDKEFGVNNINRLLKKSFLISVAGKRITIGK